MKTILVVEDDRRLARLAQLNLQAEGYQVTLHNDGSQACAYLQVASPDLVLLDLMLPTTSGWEVLRRLRQIERLQRTPVIIISAMARPEDRQRALAEGAQEYFVKPFGIQDLLRCVARLLEAEHET